VSTDLEANRCAQAEKVFEYALRSLAPKEAPGVEAHVASCAYCRRELDLLRPLVASFASWPTAELSPAPSVQARLAARIASDTGGKPVVSTSKWESADPDWEQVAPGISCKLLSTDPEKNIVSMVVRLAPGAAYPAHTHAGVEELHLLDGELWIDERKLYPGDYSRAEAGSSDRRVWSETGCTCVLITSTKDVLR
jgi:anti-sigma factor ChrR (cupin superfamily)